MENRSVEVTRDFGIQGVNEAVDGHFDETEVEPWAPCMPRAHMEAQHPKLLGFFCFIFWAIFLG
ncbi:hypothetical protein ES288_A10G250800v1 [Gossypium darwinii]|uniref:Uncharacterized protein n=2 Tax=Gossypium TaxID=3633 RepID=A0A5D2NXB7_GOSTO|nr:hypothetical protein ES288_A10G250800v1 [Gossypium darwinii]TYI07744.1 hypothetical protein ES332_A10G247000v1 [Gossypium tomentosum]